MRFTFEIFLGFHGSLVVLWGRLLWWIWYGAGKPPIIDAVHYDFTCCMKNTFHKMVPHLLYNQCTCTHNSILFNEGAEKCGLCTCNAPTMRHGQESQSLRGGRRRRRTTLTKLGEVVVEIYPVREVT